MAPATIAGATRKRPGTTDREDVIDRIIRWVELYGEPPRLADWNPGQAKATGQLWRIDRYRAGDPETGAPWPSANAARRPFGGSLDAAIRAAGFTPARRGPRPRREVDLENVGAAALTPQQRATVDAALARAREAEDRVAALEARLERARARVLRLDDDLAAARRANRRLRRQTASRSRTDVRVAGNGAAATPAGGNTDDDRAVAAARAAVRLAAQLERAEATIELLRSERTTPLARDGSGGERRRLTATELAALRTGGPSGPAVLTAALSDVARARRTGNPTALASALAALAAAAVTWRDRL